VRAIVRINKSECLRGLGRDILLVMSADRKDAMITKHTDLIIDEEFCGELKWRRHSCLTGDKCLQDY
jgi:hypothetical protein